MNKDELLKAGFILTTVEKPTKTGLFLVGEFSHGDADHDSKEEMDIESVEELKAVLTYLKWRQDTFSWNGDITYRQKAGYDKMEEDFYSVAGEQWRSEYLWDGVSDWWSRDVTSGGGMDARLDSYEVIFYDDKTKWKVTT